MSSAVIPGQRHYVCQIFVHKDVQGLEEAILYLLKCQEGRCPDLFTDRYVQFKLRIMRNVAADAGVEHSIVLSGGLRLHAVHAADSVCIYFSWCDPVVLPLCNEEVASRKRGRDDDSPERVRQEAVLEDLVEEAHLGLSRQEAVLEDSVDMLCSSFSIGPHSRSWVDVADNGAVVARWFKK